DDFNEDKALFSNDKDFQEEDSDYAYNLTPEMVFLLVKIFKGNELFANNRKRIIQNVPRNRQVKFVLPSMDKHDTQILDYSLKTLYNTKLTENKKEALEVWAILKQSMLVARSLLLTSFSHTTQVRRDLAIKAIISSHQPRAECNKLFGEELANYVKKENEISKFFNNIA
ncbi:28097_t:CDS:2, partial [Dentiscutata erythropus]